MRHNLFHQSKLGQDIEFRNTHIVFFKFPRDVMQMNTFSAPLSLGSELINWYGDATLVLYGLLLINLSPHTDNRLRYCTNSSSVPSKFYIPGWLKHLKSSNDERTESHYSPIIPINFQKKKTFFLQSCPKVFNRFLCDCVVNLPKRNWRSKNRHHVATLKVKSGCSL